MPTQRADSLPEDSVQTETRPLATQTVQASGAAAAVQPPAARPNTPAPAQITPALLKQHSITPDEYARIEKLMGRTPSLTELGIFSVMWSEHCSYKSSRVHLKRLPTRGTRTEGPGSVVQGPGENAGIIDVGDGWACAFKIESHNHPSYIEPYQGAATGVGGILRDIFTMNARPLAVMDSLRFGPLAPESSALSDVRSTLKGGDESSPTNNVERTTDNEPIDYARNRHTFSGVVAGIAGYGNCFGVPNLGGETRFEPCYSGNPLVNAFALGLVKKDEIFYAKATGVGNPVIYVGAKTGRDGIHGATMASEEFTEGSEQKRPNVQMGDPFMEKLLLEACLEAMATGAVLGIQDMGAAGLTCSTCEMGARGELGLTIELDKVPQRETGMSSYEIMLSESQERMLLVAEKGREHEVLDVFAKWGLDASIVGTVTADDTMRVLHHGELVAEIPNKALTDDAPVYKRPVGEWKAPVPKDPPAWVLEELKKPRDYTADLKKLLASANICDKRWVFEQYDSMVQTNTVQGPGGEAGVMRIKGTERPATLTTSAAETVLAGVIGFVPVGVAPTDEVAPATGQRGIAMALAGNGRWCYLDPKLGAMHAVAEAARKVACTGATPVAATNCLNFGNPEKPEIMAQLSAAIDGIAEACTALGTPITGGNVSLYNETKGEGIYPTPVVGVVGLLDDVSNAVPSAFQKAGEAICIVFYDEGVSHGYAFERALRRDFGSSEFAKTLLKETWGTPPPIDVHEERELQECLMTIAGSGLATSISDIGSGGLVTALTKAGFANRLGFDVTFGSNKLPMTLFHLFGEQVSWAIVTCSKRHVNDLQRLIGGKFLVEPLGETTTREVVVRSRDGLLSKGRTLIDTTISELSEVFTSSLPRELAAEVVTA